MIRKIVIPAAGKGTRMLDLAKDRPKHLIDVLDKPFLYYVLNNIQNAGYEEIVLVVGNHAEKMVEFSQGIGKEFPLTLIDQFKAMGAERYGTAIPVLAAAEAVGDENFVCIYGDNLYSPRDLAAIRELDDEYAWLSLLEVPNPEKYGVPIVEGDVVRDFVEKPKTFISNWVSIGCYKFTPAIFAEAAKVGKSERGEYELTDAISSLAKQGKVRARKMLDYWMDFGNPDDIKKVGDFLQQKK
ncbi:MAG: NTP transferase domain-containing protein [Parcubacteria group bacterium]|nr:NTP transferase domain-containing protein [Parcubacteria group bacterium]